MHVSIGLARILHLLGEQRAPRCNKCACCASGSLPAYLGFHRIADLLGFSLWSRVHAFSKMPCSPCPLSLHIPTFLTSQPYLQHRNTDSKLLRPFLPPQPNKPKLSSQTLVPTSSSAKNQQRDLSVQHTHGALQQEPKKNHREKNRRKTHTHPAKTLGTSFVSSPFLPTYPHALPVTIISSLPPCGVVTSYVYTYIHVPQKEGRRELRGLGLPTCAHPSHLGGTRCVGSRVPTTESRLGKSRLSQRRMQGRCCSSSIRVSRFLVASAAPVDMRLICGCESSFSMNGGVFSVWMFGRRASKKKKERLGEKGSRGASLDLFYVSGYLTKAEPETDFRKPSESLILIMTLIRYRCKDNNRLADRCTRACLLLVLSSKYGLLISAEVKRSNSRCLVLFSSECGYLCCNQKRCLTRVHFLRIRI